MTTLIKTNAPIARSIGAILFGWGILCGLSSQATELSYTTNLPQFGGTNGQALSVLQMEKQMRDTQIAKAEALQRELDRLEANPEKTPAQLLIASLTRTLNSQIAKRISDAILDGTGAGGDFEVDGVTISYLRDANGQITLTITDPDDPDNPFELEFPGV